MADPLALLRQRASQPWLIGLEPQRLADRAEQRYRQLELSDRAGSQPPQRIMLATADPLEFLAGFIAACAADAAVFLGNPHWRAAEWQSAIAIAQPHRVWGEGPPVAPPVAPPIEAAGRIMIPTGGSSGQIRFAMHTWETLKASVEGFQQYFQVDRVNSCCILPLYHVSGLMQFLRSLLSGGKLAVFPAKAAEAGPCSLDPAGYFLSLVPTQLQRLMQQPASAEWLSRFQVVLLGGAPAWEDLLETAKRLQIRLAPTYGMTETASQVATLKPEEFLHGTTGCGRLLPHAQVTICSPAGEPVPVGQVGTIALQSRALMLGYYPTPLPAPPCLQTDDLGFLDPQGYLHIVGRNSHKIITGGENVFPAEVEAAIRSSGLVLDVCVLGLPDRHWGEVVAAAYVPTSPAVSALALEAALEKQLSRFKQPKRWVALEQLPRNAQGKVNYTQLKQLLVGGSEAPL